MGLILIEVPAFFLMEMGGAYTFLMVHLEGFLGVDRAVLLHILETPLVSRF